MRCKIVDLSYDVFSSGCCLYSDVYETMSVKLVLTKVTTKPHFLIQFVDPWLLFKAAETWNSQDVCDRDQTLHALWACNLVVIERRLTNPGHPHPHPLPRKLLTQAYGGNVPTDLHNKTPHTNPLVFVFFAKLIYYWCLVPSQAVRFSGGDFSAKEREREMGGPSVSKCERINAFQWFLTFIIHFRRSLPSLFRKCPIDQNEFCWDLLFCWT